MRACTCLWGGVYNPIIPVFRVPPKEWRAERFQRVKGFVVAKGYINFFEPDVFVESEDGLLEKAGLGALREKYILENHVLTLEEFLAPQDHRDWSEPAFGLSIIDVFRHLHETEQRFELRDKRPSVLIKPERSSGLVEAVIGTYPRQKDVDYIATGYKDVFVRESLKQIQRAGWTCSNTVRKRPCGLPGMKLMSSAIGIMTWWFMYLTQRNQPI